MKLKVHLQKKTAKIMLYIIYGEDVNNSLALRQSTRSKHIERLQNLQNEGRLFVAGPCPAIDSESPGDEGFTGSVIIAKFASLDDAKQWADADPYCAAGVYQKVTVKPFKIALPTSN